MQNKCIKIIKAFVSNIKEQWKYYEFLDPKVSSLNGLFCFDQQCQILSKFSHLLGELEPANLACLHNKMAEKLGD